MSDIPSIKTAVEAPIVRSTTIPVASSVAASVSQVVVAALKETPEPEAVETSVEVVTPTEEQVAEPVVETVEVVQENFEDCWKQMVEEMLSHNSMLAYTMQKHIPKYENDIITVELSNPFQVEELQKRIRALVEYWRNHFKLNLDDFEVKVVEDKTRSTAILNTDDQFRKMKEDNPELLDFLSVLQMHIKD